MGSVRFAWRRTLASFGVLFTATVTALVATTLLVLASVLPSSVAEDAFDDAMADERAAQHITASSAYRDESWDKTDQAIRDTANRSTLDVRVTSAVWRSTFRTVGLEEDTSLVVGWLDDATAHTRLTSGRWPEPDAPQLEVVLHAAALDALGVAVDDELTPESATGEREQDPIKIVGSYEPRNPSDPLWRDYGSGVHRDGERFTVVGPALFSPDDARVPPLFGSSSAVWVLQPDLADAEHGEAERLASEVDHLTDDLRAVPAGTNLDRMFVKADVSSVLRQAGDSATSASAMLRVIVVMLALLAAWAMVFTTQLVANRRAATTALLRARGGSLRTLVRWSLLAGLPLAALSVAAAPALASLAVIPFENVGDISITSSPTAWIAAGCAAIAWLAIFVISDVAAGRSIAQVSAANARPPRRAALQRAGLDVLLLVLGAVGLQQLSRPAGDTPDIVLIAAPPLIAIAGAVVLIRALPWLGRGLAALTSRSSGITASLGAYDVARRPLRLAGVAALIILAINVSIVSSATESTWQRFQSDTVDLAQPADLRALGSVQKIKQARQVTAQLNELSDVTATAPLTRTSTSDETGADVIALDPKSTDAVVPAPGRKDDLSIRALLPLLDSQQPGRSAVVVTEGYANHFGLSTGEVMATQIQGASISATVAAIVPGIPGTTSSMAVLIDRADINVALEAVGAEPMLPNEWWIATDTGRDAAVAAEAKELTKIREVVTRSDTRAELENTAVSDGLLVGQAGALGFAVVFLLIGTVVQAIASFRAKAGEHAILRAIGLGGRGTIGAVAVENAVLLVFTFIAGCGLGLLVATLTVPHSVGGLVGLAPVPPLEVSLPWSLIRALAVGLVGLFALVVVIAAASLRKVNVVGVLRAGEDR